MTKAQRTRAAAVLGKRGGESTSAKKSAASRRNAEKARAAKKALDTARSNRL